MRKETTGGVSLLGHFQATFDCFPFCSKRKNAYFFGLLTSTDARIADNLRKAISCPYIGFDFQCLKVKNGQPVLYKNAGSCSCRCDITFQAPVVSPHIELINGGYGIKNPLLSPEYTMPKEKGKLAFIDFFIVCLSLTQ